MKQTKKLLAIVLALVMIAAMVPMTALASTGGMATVTTENGTAGTGTPTTFVFAYDVVGAMNGLSDVSDSDTITTGGVALMYLDNNSGNAFFQFDASDHTFGITGSTGQTNHNQFTDRATAFLAALNYHQDVWTYSYNATGHLLATARTEGTYNSNGAPDDPSGLQIIGSNGIVTETNASGVNQGTDPTPTPALVTINFAGTTKAALDGATLTIGTTTLTLNNSASAVDLSSADTPEDIATAVAGAITAASIGELTAFDVTSSGTIVSITETSPAGTTAAPSVSFTPVPSAPEFDSATVDGDELVITFTSNLNTTAPEPTVFTVLVDGSPIEVTEVAIENADVTLTLASVVDSGAVVTVAYNGHGLSNALVSADVGTDFVANFPARPVTNGAGAPGLTDEERGDGEGISATFHDITRLRVTLPTSAGFVFVLDPLGIHGMTKEAIENLVVDPDGDRLGTLTGPGDTWVPLPNAGQIVFTEGFAPAAINDSNRDMTFDIEMTFTAEGSGSGDITAVATPGAVSDAALNNVFIGAQFARANVLAANPTFAEADAGLMMAVLEDMRKPTFNLKEATYDDLIVSGGAGASGVVIDVYRKQIPVPDTGNGTQFRFVGECNPAADWSLLDNDVDIGIDLVYTFSEGPTVGDPIPGAHGLVAANTLTDASFMPLITGEPIELLDIVIAAPAFGAAPQTSVETEEWTAVVAWTPAVVDTFAAETTYTANITITPKSGYALPADGPFTVNSTATSSPNNGASHSFQFEATGPAMAPGFQDLVRLDAPGGGTWFDVPFNYGGDTVASVTANGASITAANFRTEKSAENIIEFNFSNNNQRDIVVTMTGGARYNIRINPTGFATADLRGAPGGNEWFDVPLYYQGRTVTGVTANGSSITAANFRTEKSAENIIEFSFSNANQRIIVVTFSGGTTSTITINPN